MAGPPPYPPPPPPPAAYGFYDNAPVAKPTSGKAIASLICGLASVVGFAICVAPAVAAPVGIVLGVIALFETGRNGPRGGRGLAIAGVIVSSLATLLIVGAAGFFFFITKATESKFEATQRASLEQDQELLLQRLKQYYDANGNSLGPGGPVLAGGRGFAPTPGEGNAPPQDTRPRVSGMLEVKHLADHGEIGAGYGGADGWKLIINGRASATLRYTDWGGQVQREVEIRDVGKGDWFVTVQ